MAKQNKLQPLLKTQKLICRNTITNNVSWRVAQFYTRYSWQHQCHIMRKCSRCTHLSLSQSSFSILCAYKLFIFPLRLANLLQLSSVLHLEYNMLLFSKCFKNSPPDFLEQRDTEAQQHSWLLNLVLTFDFLHCQCLDNFCSFCAFIENA